MCGIFLSLSRSGHAWPSEDLTELLQGRGPDAIGKLECICKGLGQAQAAASDSRTHLSFVSTVLALRGNTTVKQPFTSSEGSPVLCWNGEVWSINGQPSEANDTKAVYDILCKATELDQRDLDRADWSARAAQHVAGSMSCVAGPYAFVFFDTLHGMLYFGRDFLGRRSLLTRVSAEGELTISSVTDGRSEQYWTEVEADGVYYIDLRALHQDGSAPPDSYTPSRTPYVTGTTNNGGTHDSVIPPLFLNKHIPSVPTALSVESTSVVDIHIHLRRALACRVQSIPDSSSYVTPSGSTPYAKLAVLFSGGLDCTLLARLSHELVPLSEPIDLLNVAFENPRVHKHSAASEDKSSTAYELCPDRITGRTSHAELQQTCPDRQWRFVAINVPYSQTRAHRDEVTRLMHPHNTEMDLSIANALYFASRGVGTIHDDESRCEITFTSSARVLLSGLGADELFAGYTRHGTAFRRNGYLGLIEELDLDISRLGKRNLGRDDRIISNWGREARFPFLDEELVRWALAAPVNEKCGFGEVAVDAENGRLDGSETLDPEKKVLRCLALKLGMTNVAKEKKRAIQFGARTAKMETGRSKGTQLLS